MRSRKILLRAALALLVATVILWWLNVTAVASNGKPYAECLQICNGQSDVCNSRCKADCEALYSGDHSQISACVNTCGDVCAAQSRDCKLEAKFECKLLCVPGDPPPCP